MNFFIEVMMIIIDKSWDFNEIMVMQRVRFNDHPFYSESKKLIKSLRKQEIPKKILINFLKEDLK